MAGDIAIAVEHLNYSFGAGELRKQILFDITTDIQSGEVVIVTGPSGSGKTTLLTIVSALRSVNDGSVRVLGQELSGTRGRKLERVRRNIGFIFQQHNLLGALTARQNVELGLRVTGRFGRSELQERASEYLRIVGLGERLDHRPDQLSGGQRQRVAIARALAAEPRILMADEPTASLDRQSGRDVVDRMQHMAKEHGTTILMVTHDNRILDIADRIIYLEDGRLSNFNEAIIDSSQHVMRAVARGATAPETIDDQGGFDFQYLLVQTSLQAQRILALRGRVNESAFDSILLEGLQDFSGRLLQALDADSLALFLADPAREFWHGSPLAGSPVFAATYPLHAGLAGATLEAGQVLRVADAESDTRCSPELEWSSGQAGGSYLSLPVRSVADECFAIVRMHRHSGRPAFTAEEAHKFSRFFETLAPSLEQFLPQEAR